MLDTECLLDFLEFGIVAPGMSFDLSKRGSRINPLPPPSHSDEPTPRAVYKSLCKAVIDILEKKKPNAVAMSGGADSRLLLATLEQTGSDLKQLKFYCRIHPELGPQKDRDYLISSKICSLRGVKLEPEVSQSYSQMYLRSQGNFEQKPLSGLWGGELLGGAILSHQTFNVDQVLFSQRKSQLKEYLRSLPVEVLKPEKSHALFAHLLLNTRKSAFYGSLSWFNPQFAEQFTFSPFLDRSVLDLIFSLPSSALHSYKFYNRVLALLDVDLQKIPINNLSLAPSFREGLENYGIEPKSLKPHLTTGQHWSDLHAEVLQFCDRHPNLKYSPYLSKLLPHIQTEELV